MSKTILLCTATLLSIFAMVAAPAGVSAVEKKLTYEEAFKKCKVYLDQEKGGLAPGATNEMTRSKRGAACMKKYGHRI